MVKRCVKTLQYHYKEINSNKINKLKISVVPQRLLFKIFFNTVLEIIL